MNFLQRNWHIFLALAGVALAVPAAIAVVSYFHPGVTAVTSVPPTATTEVATATNQATPPDDAANVAPAEGPFTKQLAPYGRWINSAHYGRVWAPRVAHDWRPYTVGHWSYSDDYGWYWNSDEAWSDTYHYGRWDDDAQNGWVWVPDTVWAPSWVTWRQSDDYYGWAPLPPEGDGDNGTGQEIYAQPALWVFVPVRYFGAAHLHRDVIPYGRNATLIRQTTVLNNVRVVNNFGVNRGFDPRDVATRTSGAVPRFTGRPDGTVQPRAEDLSRARRNFRDAPPAPAGQPVLPAGPHHGRDNGRAPDQAPPAMRGGQPGAALDQHPHDHDRPIGGQFGHQPEHGTQERSPQQRHDAPALLQAIPGHGQANHLPNHQANHAPRPDEQPKTPSRPARVEPPQGAPAPARPTQFNPLRAENRPSDHSRPQPAPQPDQVQEHHGNPHAGQPMPGPAQGRPMPQPHAAEQSRPDNQSPHPVAAPEQPHPEGHPEDHPGNQGQQEGHHEGGGPGH